MIAPRYRPLQLVTRWGPNVGEEPISIPISGLIVDVQPTRHYRVLNHTNMTLERWAEANVLTAMPNMAVLEKTRFVAEQLLALYDDLKRGNPKPDIETLIRVGRAIQLRINRLYGDKR